MKQQLHFAVMALVLLGTACKKDSPEPGQSGSEYHDSGIVVVSTATVAGRGSYYAGYYGSFEEAKSIDLTQRNSYEYFWSFGQSGNYFYGTFTPGQQKYSKMAVSKETGLLTEVGSFPLATTSYYSVVCSENLGVIAQYGELDLITFDPATMQTTGTIDMSGATHYKPGEHRHTYYSGAYRAKDNKLFLFYYTDDQRTALFYDATDVFVEVIDLNTRKWVKTITYEGAQYPISRGKENAVIDEAGNIYVTCQGSYGLDGQMGMNAMAASRPKILKIDAATDDFDTSYSFNPVDALGYQNLMIQTLTGTIYGANGIAYACVNATDESPELQALIYKYATTGVLAEDEIAKLYDLAFYSVTQRWVKLDLNAKTASIIDDIPATGSFAYPTSYKHSNGFYFHYYDGTTSGYYRYDPAANKAEKAITITKGGLASELLILGD